MSYTTLPIINRLKITNGWVSPEFQKKQGRIADSLKWFKTFSLLKSFLKFNNWHLLEVQRTSCRGTILWSISAVKLKKKRRKFNCQMKITKKKVIVVPVVQRIKNALIFKKKIALLKKYFRNRKKLFVSYWSSKGIKYAKDNRNGKIRLISQKKLQNKKWVSTYINSAKQAAFFKKNWKEKLRVKKTVYILKELKNNFRTYDLDVQRWLALRTKKIKIKKLRASKKYDKLIRKSSNPKNKKIVHFKRCIKSKSVTKIKNKRRTRFRKYTKFTWEFKKIESQAWNCFKKHIRFSWKLKKEKELLFNKSKKRPFVLSNRVVKKFNSKFLVNRYKNKSYYKKIKVVRIRNKFDKKIFRKGSLNIIKKHLVWIKNYTKFRKQRKIMIKQFRNTIQRRKKLRIEFKLSRQRKLKFRKFILNLIRNKYKKMFRHNLKWKFFLELKRKERLRNMLKRKTIFNTFKLNYFLKKILFYEIKQSNIIVKFTQPLRLLLSSQKLKRIAKSKRDLIRYKRQKMYKRILTTLTLLFKYWHPQPLADQIAYELEKTSKHWPLLKGIRSLVKKLRPRAFSGFRIAIKGKINASDRTRTFFIKDGRLPLKTFASRMNFSMCQSKARTGSFGIRCWFYNSN